MIAPATAGYLLLGVGCVWMTSKLAVQWHYHLGFETRREQEARMLVQAVCNTVEGASLANEFAKCEQARIILMDTKVVWIKAFEKTLEATLSQIIDFFSRTSLTTAWNFSLCAALLCAIGLMCKFTTDVLQRDKNEMDLFSPVAQHRILAPSSLNMGRHAAVENKKII